MTNNIDQSDRVILGELQDNARLSLEALANACGLSTASVQRRLKRLRDAKIIEGEVVVVNPSALGQHMTFIVMVELERERIDQLDAFRRIVRKETQVQQCYYVTGEADFTLICTARDMRDFEALTQRLFFENTNIRRFRTSVVMDRTKVSLSISTEE
jgi:DNA-binding Lrp family transcriptional regulator|tara:strand:+ start:3820 stop:4290 length:471 start_codon:yes stop_codon:yes gene_type:complete